MRNCGIRSSLRAADLSIPNLSAPDWCRQRRQTDAIFGVLCLFSALGLSDEIVRAVAARGYIEPTPIQSQAIPAVLSGKDLLAGAQTGTGKNGWFYAADPATALETEQQK